MTRLQRFSQPAAAAPSAFPQWYEMPFSLAELERYRVRAQRHQRGSMVGAHILRRRGASLDFREFTPYVIGDDTRYIDWRASARNLARRRPSTDPTAHLLMRRFETEEKFQLVISVDMRPTMRLPGHLQKLQIAAWLAETLAWLGLRSGDNVILHRLFGRGGTQSGLANLSPRAGWKNICAILERQRDETFSGGAEQELNLRALERHLPPTAVWVVITDLYFGNRSGDSENEKFPNTLSELGARIARARDGMRWVVPVDLDSWNYERSLLVPPKDRTRAFRITGPAIEGFKKGKVDRSVFEQIEREIEDHKLAFRERAGLPREHDLKNEVYWKWDTQDAWKERAAQHQEGSSPAQNFFRERFRATRVIERLFMREHL